MSGQNKIVQLDFQRNGMKFFNRKNKTISIRSSLIIHTGCTSDVGIYSRKNLITDE